MTKRKPQLELNPGLPWAHYHYGWYLDLTGRLDEAEVEMIMRRLTL